MSVQTRSLTNEVWELVRAGFSGIWIETHESSEVLFDLARLCSTQSLRLMVWNLDTGLKYVGNESVNQDHLDPLSAVRSLSAVPDEKPTLLVLENFHRFVDSPEICQALITQLNIGKQMGRHVIVLAPMVRLPTELERLFAILRHELPDREQIWEIARSLMETATLELQDQAREQLLDAAVGLTRLEAESAFSLSLVRHGSLSSTEVWQLKSRWLKKSGLLSLHRSDSGFDSLGGLSNLKQFCSKSLRRPAAGTARPRGVMLLGVPGTGKSAFAKALGSETGRPVLVLDVGQLMGALVGQTEANIRAALHTADAMSPCILFIDEVEKALAGASAGGRGDSGVSSRLFGTLLTWLNDHQSDVYVVVTCNNIQQLPPEFSRAERFDAIMFLDLPCEQEKQAIWELYRSEYGLSASQAFPPDDCWTGAEIKACCRLAALLDIPLVDAAQFIVPVGVTAAESVEALRGWASGRCLDAGKPRIYQAPARGNKASRSSKHGVSVRPSVN